MDYNTLKDLIEDSLRYVAQNPSLVEMEIKNLTEILWEEIGENK